jgi:hypothetical protein
MVQIAFATGHPKPASGASKFLKPAKHAGNIWFEHVSSQDETWKLKPKHARSMLLPCCTIYPAPYITFLSRQGVRYIYPWCGAQTEPFPIDERVSWRWPGPGRTPWVGRVTRYMAISGLNQQDRLAYLAQLENHALSCFPSSPTTVLMSSR